jgi:hypothetical protein
MQPVVIGPDRPRRARIRLGSSRALGAGGVPIVIVLAGIVLAGQLSPGRAPAALGAVPPTPTASPSAAIVAASRITPTPRCDVTVPDPRFSPPDPDLRTPPAYYGTAWYGTADLWTMLDLNGEVWGPWVRVDQGLPQKTFWWSVDWVPQDELQPAITVIGQRLDASGSFRFGDPGTNATADFGTAMLVGIDIPTYGCWRITARYRAGSLSYVVSIVDH